MEKKYFVHGTSVVDEGAKVGEGTKIWHFSHISAGAIVGNNCIFGQNVFVAGDVTIGNNVKVQNNVSIYDRIIIEDHVFCGPSCVFTNVINPRSEYPRDRKTGFKETVIKRGATLGANSTVVCGVTVGKYAFIGAGSVVTKDIPDYALVYGNPARLRGWMCECGEKLHSSGELKVCPKCPIQYIEERGMLKRKS